MLFVLCMCVFSAYVVDWRVSIQEQHLFGPYNISPQYIHTLALYTHIKRHDANANVKHRKYRMLPFELLLLLLFRSFIYASRSRSIGCSSVDRVSNTQTIWRRMFVVPLHSVILSPLRLCRFTCLMTQKQAREVAERIYLHRK